MQNHLNFYRKAPLIERIWTCFTIFYLHHLGKCWGSWGFIVLTFYEGSILKLKSVTAMDWATDPVDLYDCRMRSWYIEAATSPKDVLILVDNSGSMMGQRKEIARHLVNTILDTLGNNDYVNIMSFVNDTREIVECYKDMLVQVCIWGLSGKYYYFAN